MSAELLTINEVIKRFEKLRQPHPHPARARSRKKVYRTSFKPGLYDVCTIFEKPQ